MEMEKVKVFLLGVIMAIGLMFLIGASNGQTGRYQIAAIGQQGTIQIVDTATGDVYGARGPKQRGGLDKLYTIKE